AFWTGGYNATSMDALVAATGVSRHGIYKNFPDKHALYLACFDAYQAAIVSPAFDVVEDPAADLDAIAQYFETQISAADQAGLPGPGCFVANAATEVAPHDHATAEMVTAHNKRLRAGFANALRNALPELDNPARDALADACLVFATGVWSLSRVATDPAPLRAAVGAFLHVLKPESPP
ncbi:MAG: TetR/AcrR family transcriptional regulator, partial [Pseudomonadota bacterium]